MDVDTVLDQTRTIVEPYWALAWTWYRQAPWWADAIVIVLMFFIMANAWGHLVDLFLPNTTTITDRERKPWYLKIFIPWWFLNDSEQTVDEAPWYLPDRPYWYRWMFWNVFRNFAQNFFCFVLGVADRNYTVVAGPADPLVIQLDDLVPPQFGFQLSVIKIGVLRLPWVCYSGRRVVLALGWQPNGKFEGKVNIHRS
jgi:hypothetical protein